jgi:hypothetical protein
MKTVYGVFSSSSRTVTATFTLGGGEMKGFLFHETSDFI